MELSTTILGSEGVTVKLNTVPISSGGFVTQPVVAVWESAIPETPARRSQIAGLPVEVGLQIRPQPRGVTVKVSLFGVR
jgi:hypothetical protein